MKLVASALALLLLGAGSIFLWKDASAQEDRTRPGVVVSSDAAAPSGPLPAAGTTDEPADPPVTRQDAREAVLFSQTLALLQVWNHDNPVAAAAEQAEADKAEKEKAAKEKAEQEKAEKEAEEKAAAEAARQKEQEAAQAPPSQQPAPPRAVSPPPVNPGGGDDDDDWDDWDDDDDDDDWDDDDDDD